jgi:hypothetical protein
MRISFLPRPTREELWSQPLHVIVRDFPETLEDFRAHGIPVDEMGSRTLQDFEDPGELLDDLEASTFWRPGVGSA